MQAYRWVIDSRDEYTDERLEKLGGDMKLGECYQIGLCSLACPKGLNPRGALAHLKELYEDYDKKKDSEMMQIWAKPGKYISKHQLGLSWPE